MGLKGGGLLPNSPIHPVLTYPTLQFLNGLSVEYERRLLAKDQELNTSKESLKLLQKQVEGLQTQLDTIAGKLAEEKHQQMELLAQEAQERVRQLEDELAEARLVISQHAEELAMVRAALGTQDGERSQREEALLAQLEGAMLRVQEFELLQQRFNEVREENKKLYNTIQVSLPPA